MWIAVPLCKMLLPTTLVGWYVEMTWIQNGRLNQGITRKMAQTLL